jgi:hypothetical protein
MNIFLFHCWGGNGRSCWSGWIADQLIVLGCEASGKLAGEACMVSGLASSVLLPDFPNSSTPQLEEWLAKTRELVPRFEPKDNWVLVGHSLGCPTILRLLETFNDSERVKAVILVAGFAKDLGISEIRNFVDRDFDWKKIKKKAKKFIVINSDNDPFIELSEGERMAKLLEAEFIVEHDAGHINEGAGFTKYERLLDMIKKEK